MAPAMVPILMQFVVLHRSNLHRRFFPFKFWVEVNFFQFFPLYVAESYYTFSLKKIKTMSV